VPAGREHRRLCLLVPVRPLDEERRRILLRCLRALEKVVPSIGEEGGAVEYYERLREMAELATELGNSGPR
jgi:hypothetical protein